MNVFLVRTHKIFHNEILTLYAFDFTIKHKSIDHKIRRTKSIRKAEKEKIMKQRLIFATGNEHKMKEIREILDESKYEIIL